MAQLTLVALIGDKTPALHSHLVHITDAVMRSPLRPYFRPYPLAQIHATMVGLERVPLAGHYYNANHFAATGDRRSMKLDCVLALARDLPRLTIRFGGFKPDDRRVDSFGATPYVRSFQIQLDRGNVIAIGWHHRSGDFDYAHELWELRRRFADHCCVRPKYWLDSDFFMTLGKLTELPPAGSPAVAEMAAVARELEAHARTRLAASPPVDVQITPADLAIARYVDAALPQASTDIYRVDDPRLNAATLRHLYADKADVGIDYEPH